MSRTTIHVFHTGKVHVSPYLPFGGDDCGLLKASGTTTPKKDWIWLPVSCYLIEHEKGLILVDCGWDRSMSPEGKYDKKAQIRSLGSRILYHTNQGIVGKGETITEQLEAMGLRPEDLDYVLLTHLDCDHANGLPLVKDAKNILVSADELICSQKSSFTCRVRYQEIWWKGTKLKTFQWNDCQGPAGKSFDLFGDGSVEMINIPGHCDGLCAAKIFNEEGKFVLLYSDGGYSERSWKEMITPGISMDKEQQKKSLAWIREQSLDPDCIESLANHDGQVEPHTITL